MRPRVLISTCCCRLAPRMRETPPTRVADLDAELLRYVAEAEAHAAANPETIEVDDSTSPVDTPSAGVRVVGARALELTPHKNADDLLARRAGSVHEPARRRGQGPAVLPARLRCRPRLGSRDPRRRHPDQRSVERARPGLCRPRLRHSRDGRWHHRAQGSVRSRAGLVRDRGLGRSRARRSRTRAAAASATSSARRTGTGSSSSRHRPVDRPRSSSLPTSCTTTVSARTAAASTARRSGRPR